jgi:uncharacterized protein YdeI (YjbR/CyaY-like superfamily)
MKSPDPTLIMEFESPDSFENWLGKNYTNDAGIWLRIYKKDSGIKSITYKEALDVLLCYGWIDGLKLPYDQEAWLQKICPRRPKSLWSKINTGHVARLIREGKMKTPGFIAIERAKADGSWNVAYNSPGKLEIPEDFLQELSKNKSAESFFKTLNKTNLYSISFRLQTAKKPETREKRMKQILEMLERGEKFH